MASCAAVESVLIEKQEIASNIDLGSGSNIYLVIEFLSHFCFMGLTILVNPCVSTSVIRVHSPMSLFPSSSGSDFTPCLGVKL